MRGIATRAATVVVGLVVVLLLLGHLLGQPILLGYVATESMEPTMDAGDGFVAIPDAVSGSPEEGDVVVFQARELHGGGLTTHRIVDETDEGYVTKGDGNPFTDQDADEPPVTDDQIVATAWQVNGEVVTIPHLGTAVMGANDAVETGYEAGASALGASTAFDADDAGALLVAVGVALLGFGILFEGTGARRETKRSRNRENVIGIWTAIALVLLVFTTFGTAAMVVPSGVYEYGLVSTDSPTDDPQVVAPGERATVTRSIENAGYVPIVVVHDADGDDVRTDPEWQTVGIRDRGETTVEMEAPDSSGEYVRHVGEHRYLAVLPPAALVGLHELHPLAAIAAVNAVIVAATVAVVVALFGTADIRVRRPGGHIPLATRLQRKLRKWL
ncbi:S26 family signal peptidase [Natrialbaceae archaeon GCM10025810]|uniref:S26 family signal peptidase n=1 Tax=Halovalidus salilacus TaxID=3075124 RepID=UPI00360DDF8D